MFKICKSCNESKSCKDFENVFKKGKGYWRNRCKSCRKLNKLCKVCGKITAKILCSFKCRFLSWVDKTQDCWIWNGVIKQDGYGALMVDGKSDKRAHRVSYELFKNKIGFQKLILHTCNKKLCVNPDHLYEGTVKDNARDAIRDGVLLRGEKSKSSKLTEEQILKIRELGKLNFSQNEISKKFDVSQVNIGLILNRKIWKHI